MNKAKLLQNKAAQIQNQSLEYEILANDLVNQSYLQTNVYNGSGEINNEQARMKEELQMKEMKDAKNKQIQIDYERQTLQNQYQEANAKGAAFQNIAKNLKITCRQLRNMIYQTDIKVRDLQQKLRDAAARNQTLWYALSNQLKYDLEQTMKERERIMMEYNDSTRKLDEIMNEIKNNGYNIDIIKKKISLYS